MKTFRELYEQIMDEGHFPMLMLNPLAQFQTESTALLGSRLLPERLVPQNEYRETEIRWKTRPALDNNRYSPTQMQAGGQLIGGFLVELGHTDTQSQLTPKEYDDLLILLARENGDMDAIARLIRWADMMLVRPHTLKNEIQRWHGWLRGVVERRTVDGNMEPIEFYREPGHLLTIPGGTEAAPAGWHDPSYEIFDDIGTAVELLEDQGYQATALYSSPALARTIKRNDTVKAKNSYTVIRDGQLVTRNPRLTTRQLGEIFLDESFPNLITYNGGYEGVDGFQRFMDVEDGYDYMLVTGSTSRNYDMVVDYPGTSGLDVSGFTENSVTLDNVLGYYAVGRNAGKGAAGRTVNTWRATRKPEGLGGESYQTGLPVTQDPQSYVVLRVQRPA